MHRTIQSLDDVAPDERGVYLESPDGGFLLHPEVVATLDRHEAELANAQARLVRADARLRRAVIDRAVSFALEAARVEPLHRRAVAALILETVEFEAVAEGDGHQAYAVTAYGRVSVSSAVQAWLASPAGDPFRPKLTVKGSGRYAQMMGALRTVH